MRGDRNFISSLFQDQPLFLQNSGGLGIVGACHFTVHPDFDGVLIRTNNLDIALVHLHRQRSARLDDKSFGEVCFAANINQLID